MVPAAIGGRPQWSQCRLSPLWTGAVYPRRPPSTFRFTPPLPGDPVAAEPRRCWQNQRAAFAGEKSPSGLEPKQQALLSGLGISLGGIVTDGAVFVSARRGSARAFRLGGKIPAADYPKLLLRKAVLSVRRNTLLLGQSKFRVRQSWSGGEARATLCSVVSAVYARCGVPAACCRHWSCTAVDEIASDDRRPWDCARYRGAGQVVVGSCDQLDQLEAEIERVVGHRGEPQFPKQLAELLFEKLGLPPVKKTKGKTGLSVDAEVLEALAARISRRTADSGIPQLTKAQGTLHRRAAAFGQQDKRGDCTRRYQQVVAATGRLSSTDPDLQNIPVRSELGQKIRAAFVAAPGHLLIAADYSQIELRVRGASRRRTRCLSTVPFGEDVHTRTAIENVRPRGRQTPRQATAAKMINYGIVYGLTDYGLATRAAASNASWPKRYIRRIFRALSRGSQLHG